MATDPLFYIRTYGCQMNVHDSQKLSNLLLHAGFAPGRSAEESDLLVINTCSIRDKAENQLYSDLGQLRAWRAARSGRVIGVGGCVAQQVGDALMKRFAHLDFVFGTHNLRLVPAMVAAARSGVRSANVEASRSLDRFDLPGPHPASQPAAEGRAFVTVMEGCDMFCSFCIVPTTRGREISRPAADILAEARALADAGVREITLLGQTVNAYGRHARSRRRSSGELEFAELLARLDAVPGLARIRYTSPHPLFFDEALIAAHGELPSLCPHVHLPLQSGSDRILRAMRRRYEAAAFLEITRELRRRRPDIAVTSDLIVGFPGEIEADFEQTLAVVREAGFVDSYSFKYSPRPGTAAAGMPGAVAAEEAQRRLGELQTLQRELTIAYHRSRVGTCTEILVEGASRRGGGQLCGRDPYHRIVNLSHDSEPALPGELLAVEILEATPHSLIGHARAAAPTAAGNPDRILSRAVKLDARSAEEEGRSGGPAWAGAPREGIGG